MTGIISDQETGLPIVANIIADGTQIEAVSGSDGRFLLTGLNDGVHQLSVRNPDYNSAVFSVELKNGVSDVGVKLVRTDGTVWEVKVSAEG